MIKKENRIFSVMMFCMIFVMLFAIAAGKVVAAQITARESADSSDSSDTPAIDWEELYPYDRVVEEVVPETSSADASSGKTSAAAKIISLLSRFNTVGSSRIKKAYGYSAAAKLGFIISSRLTDPGMGDVYIRLNNGWWIWRSGTITEKYAEEMTASYASLNNLLAEEGTDFIFFLAPDKECAVDLEYPDEVTSYANYNFDLYLTALEDYGVECVDLREELHADGLDHYSMFYKTDHHWTTEAGLWAASVTAEKISEKLGIEMIDPLSVGEYREVTFPGAEFGSIGNAVTHFAARAEDYTVFYPEFETCYRVEVPGSGVDVTGSFEDVFVDEERLNQLSESGGGTAYDGIMYFNPPYLKITNYNNPDGPKVLVIRDSFADGVGPYLAASCSELVMIDARPACGNFTGSVVNVIDQFKPDIVIALEWQLYTISLNK